MANQNYGNNNRPSDSGAIPYVGAPYNFVPISEKVYPYPEAALPAHDQPDEIIDAEKEAEFVSGEIVYKVTAQTPVFVGSGIKAGGNAESFFRDVKGHFAIPGSTMRGLVRSNVQILSYSSFADDIDDYALMFRKVGARKSDIDRDPYKTILGADTIPLKTGDKSTSISVLMNVRAGYVRKKGGKYFIYDTVLDQVDPSLGKMNYYVLSERKIASHYEECKRNGGTNRFDFFWKNGTCILQNVMKDHQTFIKKEGYVKPNGVKVNPKYIGEINKKYRPYAIPCSYEVSGREVTAVGNPGKYKNNGYAVSTGIMQEKKAVYIIPQIDPTHGKKLDEYDFPIKIPDEDYNAFQIDLNRKKTSLKNFDGPRYSDLPPESFVGIECFYLPDDDRIKPVFFILSGNHIYFGFTPRLRLFYDHTIHDGIPFEQKTDKIDFAKALFGYAHQKESYKTRLSFSDAVVCGNASENPQEDRILAEPKPTSVMDYLIPIDSEKADSYNSDNFRLRGIKQYWVRQNADMRYGLVDSDKKDKDFVSHFLPLQAGTCFTGKIRFQHLKKEELGLLLWAIHPEDNSLLNIGKAKAFGFGTIELKIETVRILDMEKAYNPESLHLDPFQTMTDSEIQEAVQSYKTELSDFLEKKRPEDEGTISTFLLMKNKVRIPEDDRIRQMTIGNKQRNIPNEYQSRIPLPSPESIAKPKSAETELIKASMKEGSVYTAKVTKIEGKHVKFRIESLEINDRFPAENIVYAEITRNMLKDIFKINDLVEVILDRCEQKEDGKQIMIWKCLKKI